jgi:outer membrane protein assembly factor BamB
MRPMIPILRGAAAIGLLACSYALAADWTQFGYDAAHTGNNTAETTIGIGNVTQLTTLYNVDLPAGVDSAPIYVSNVATTNGSKNVLFAFGSSSLGDFSSTMGTIMAVDASDGSVIWSQNTTGSSQHASASPAVDAARQFVYSFGVDGYVHKYAIGTGVEVMTGGPTGWPQAITLKPDVEKVASGLTIASTGGIEYLVAVTNGYDGDGGDYQGHIVSINLSNGVHTIFNAMCSTVTMLLAEGGCPSGRESGIWGRGGAAYDAETGQIYVTTGNGQFRLDSTHHNWGDSVLALGLDGSGSGGGMPRDSYTPTNFQDLDNSDTDLGSISLAIVRAPAGSSVANIGVQGGKDAQLRIINLDDMSGQGGPGQVGGELQLIDAPAGAGGMREQPAAWVDTNGDGASWVFVTSFNGVAGVKMELNGTLPSMTPVWQVGGAATSAILANGILYSFAGCSGNTCVVARDPTTGDVLWNSDTVSQPHWQSPILINGVIYAIDGNGSLWAFGLPRTDDIFNNGFDP